MRSGRRGRVKILPTGVSSAALIGLACGLLLCAGGARADWLVLADGTAFEIQGAAKTKGKLVVFKTADGKLASLRLEDVDLDASARRTEDEERRKLEPPPEKAKPKVEKKAVLVLTDADVRHVPRGDRGEASGDEEAEADESPAAAPARRQQLRVRSWDQIASNGDVKVAGVLENRDPHAAALITLHVRILDDEGALMAEKTAGLGATTLLPTQSTPFEAVFENLPSFGSVTFETTSTALAVGRPDTPPPTTD